MRPDKQFWEYEDGHWTLASLLMRSLCYSARDDDFISYAELYYVLDTLDAKDRFSDYWDRPIFYQQVGIPKIAFQKVDESENGWRARKGDIAWTMGDLSKAEEYYQADTESSYLTYEPYTLVKDSHSWFGAGNKLGWDGLFRVAFSTGEYSRCVKLFNRFCPPNSYYNESTKLRKEYEEICYRDYLLEHHDLLKKYIRSCPCFISDCKTMAKAVVIAFLKTDGLSAAASQMISDYFNLSSAEVGDLALTLKNNEKELGRVLKYIEPKRIRTKSSFEQLLTDGATAKATTIIEKLLSYEQSIREVTATLREFLDTGVEEILDKIINGTPPFGYHHMDSIALSAALEPIVENAVTMPQRQLILLRKFCLITPYPSGGQSLKYKWGWQQRGLSYFGEFTKIIKALEIPPEPIDIIIGIRQVNWYKQGYNTNNKIIYDQMEWCMTLLPEFIKENYQKGLYSQETTMIAFLRDAYEFLEQKYEDAQNKQRWVSEEMLAKAIKFLFGKDRVQQHAHPIWLTPQHLDIFLPEFNLAIEYMGKQHYEPVDFFGG